MNYWTQSKNNIYVAAHRGWSSKYPENTLKAMKAAVDLGVDQLEIDVRVTKDNELVIIHDATVDRTTNGTGKVCDFTLEELKALDACNGKGEEFKGIQIPTLIEFMELIKNHPTMTLDVELKEYPVPRWEDVAYDVCDRVLHILDDYGYSERCVINTWSGRLHEYIWEKYGEKYKLHLYYPVQCMEGKGKYRTNLYMVGYCCCMFSPTKSPEDLGMAPLQEFEAMRARGIRTWAGASVKDEAGVDLAIANGAELITCDNPDVILQLLRAKGKHK